MARIFISYKRVDKDKVFKIKDQIESALGEKCWIDLEGIESDAQFANVIINAINASDVFLFMYSSAHAKNIDYKNDWTIRELDFAQHKKKRIVFVNLDASVLTDWFYMLFGTMQQVDATNPDILMKLIQDIGGWLGIKQNAANKKNIKIKLISCDNFIFSKKKVLSIIQDKCGIGEMDARRLIKNVPVELPVSFSVHDATDLARKLRFYGCAVDCVCESEEEKERLKERERLIRSCVGSFTSSLYFITGITTINKYLRKNDIK